MSNQDKNKNWEEINMREPIDYSDLMLTEEELDSFEWVRNLSPNQKSELSLLVLELSLALYNLYSDEDE